MPSKFEMAKRYAKLIWHIIKPSPMWCLVFSVMFMAVGVWLRYDVIQEKKGFHQFAKDLADFHCVVKPRIDARDLSAMPKIILIDEYADL